MVMMDTQSSIRVYEKTRLRCFANETDRLQFQHLLASEQPHQRFDPIANVTLQDYLQFD